MEDYNYRSRISDISINEIVNIKSKRYSDEEYSNNIIVYSTGF